MVALTVLMMPLSTKKEEDRDKAYEEALERQRRLKDYDWDYVTYETEIE